MVALGLGKPGKLENIRENNFFFFQEHLREKIKTNEQHKFVLFVFAFKSISEILIFKTFFNLLV